MENEQNRALEAVKIAIQMEIDGKQYYLKAGQSSNDALGKKLFQQLAEEEDQHREKFEEIFHALEKQKAWPTVDFKPQNRKAVKTLFASASESVKPSASELEAVRNAMTMENKTRDFYQEQAKKATFTAEKTYYDLLVQEESVHHALLLDYFEYINNPAGYFTIKERHSLDGG